MSIERVIIVGDFADITGGQAKVAIDSAQLLAETGIEVIFFAAIGPIHASLKRPGIEVVCLDQKDILSNANRLQAAASGLWNAKAARALGQVIEKYAGTRTVVHCHGYAKALSPSVGHVLQHTKLPTVFTMHEYFLACPNGGFYDYQKNEICTRKALGVACLTTNCDARRPAHKAWRVVRGVLAKGRGALPRGLNDVIYISELQRRIMAPYLRNDVRLHHLSNPVAAGGGPVDSSKNDAFVFVGRLNPEKGGLMFAKAAKEAGLKAVFVGDGPERDAIASANPDATITGWKSSADVQKYLSKARALVFPSLWYEGQPLVPMEALLRGIPVVCGANSAAAEVVTDGVNGVIYDAKSQHSLELALQKVRSIGEFQSDDLAQRTSGAAHVAGLLRIYSGLFENSA